jgi:DNA transformation protein and related proteins
MPVNQSYCDYVLEQLAGLGDVVAKRMFGGMGLYHKDVFFAVLDDDQLYFKVNDDSRPDYLSAGMRPFRPTRDGPASKTYYQVPDMVLQDARGVQEWARKAITAAKKKPRKRKSPPPGL